ncbi:MAG: tRNA (N(6)-L-threonylcarbamoyladenosine(37)-C(2))-methylthiotransferase MtaB [Dialister sp.]|nr:tRNA (N(6)-L-threonylcarbamoyladenosine(37)-C(2))-methylthiotransferase MtaB [Dialister sp.]
MSSSMIRKPYLQLMALVVPCYNEAMEMIHNTRKKTVSFITLGCKVNQYDSDAMRSLFIRRGYETAEGEGEADVYVINTCSVTSVGDKKSRQTVRRIRRNHPDAVIAVAGCYAQLEPDVFEKMGGANVIIGLQNRTQIVDYVEEAKAGQVLNKVKDIREVREFENMAVDAEGETRTRAFIKVQEGCDNYCTFCIIPYARGRLKSRKLVDAVAEIRRLVKAGYREVVLTGIHLGNYGKDLRDGTSLASLVEALLEIPGLLRIRLGSVESVELSGELVRIIRDEPRVCSHLHLPIQSGSDSVLKRMNRHYRLAEYKRLIKDLREAIPGLALTTDLIVGFPGETEAEFQETLDTLKELSFSGIHVFPYSRREGTPAARYPNQLTAAEKKDRVRRVMELEKEISQVYRETFEAKEVRVIAEEIKDGAYEGLSDEYIRVRLSGEGIRRGHMYRARVTGLAEEGLAAAVIKEERYE